MVRLGTTGCVIDTTIGLLNAVAEVTQPAFEVISTITTSLLLRVELPYTALFVPTFNPFTFHWYEGAVPLFDATALKTMGVPAHTEFADAVILTDGATCGVTVTAIPLLSAVVFTTQDRLEVNSTVTTSLLLNEDVLNTELLPPTLEPLIFH